MIHDPRIKREYKLFELMYPDGFQINAQMAEDGLNKLAAEGWVFVEKLGAVLLLVRETVHDPS
jgi:hypothetical protein